MDVRDAEEARAAEDNLVKRSPRHHEHEGRDSDDNDTHTSASKDMCETEKELSTEQMFQNRKVPPWWQQITFRGVIVSFMISVLLSIIVMKLNLTTGIIPSLNMSAGLLGFFLIRSYTEILDRVRILRTPFTRQENTVIQTCIVAAVGVSFSGGFGSYLFAMSPKVYQQTGDVKGNNPDTVKEPGLGWIIGFLFVVSFLGLFSVVALRKIMIIDYKLTYPSGTATAVLINGFHTPAGARMAGKQLVYLGRFFGLSFLWSFFQWFYAGGDECGFNSFPTLGLTARHNRFYFDFNMTYVGAGMICPHKVNLSLMAGGILSWGIMWPLLRKKEGDWFPAGNNSNQNDMQGLYGYKVFIAIALILGDGLYTFVKILYITMITMAKDYKRRQKKLMTNGADEKEAVAEESISFDERKRTEVFLKDSIPNWLAVLVYVVLAMVSISVIPRIFRPMKWYFVLVAYLIAPFLAFCNAYGCGLTDWSLASSYGKLAIFIFGAWAGAEGGGVLAGLVACGVTMSIVSTASDLTQDMKTGYMTLSSPRSMLVSQIIGTSMGCVIAPCIFWLFYTAFNIGGQGGGGATLTDYAVPFGITYRNMAILGVEGLRALPYNCITFCGAFFALAIFLNVLRDRLPPRAARLVPLPTAMAIPFYLGAYFAIDMLVGSAVVAAWHKLDPSSAHKYSMSVASGLLCGDGVWTLPASVLALANVKAPICMKFLSGSQNQRVNAFLTHHE